MYEYDTPPTRVRVRFTSSETSTSLCAIASLQTADVRHNLCTLYKLHSDISDIISAVQSLYDHASLYYSNYFNLLVSSCGVTR